MRQRSGDLVEAGRRPEDRAGPDEAARKRAAVELLARHESTIRRTARRYSICAEDAEDAFQRALEILLTKAPSDQLRDLVPWMQTVTKHEALAVRRKRERLLGTPPRAAAEDDDELDWLALVPASGDGPPDQAVRREAVARSREALRALKPAELRALTLLAEGYSYAEISAITGFSRTKVNRCLAEGRERFRRLVSESEAGGRCAELEPLLSRFCDDEANPDEAETLREHLRACAHCRSTLRSYRAAPRAAALLPALPLWHSLMSRTEGLIERLRARLPGRGGLRHAAAGNAAAGGGTSGAGVAGLTKAIVVCAAAAGAAGCVAAGFAGLPSGVGASTGRSPAIVGGQLRLSQTGRHPSRTPAPARRRPAKRAAHRGAAPPLASPSAEATAPAQEPTPVEYEPPPAEYEAHPVEGAQPEAQPVEPSPEPEAQSVGPSPGTAAGEFGP
jgi:RNA polymerase sigma factor (sigma-70 family)